MSSGYLYGNGAPERPYGGRPAVKARSISDKGLKRILALIIVILSGELVWFFGVSPCMPFSRITVSGIPGIEESAVLALAGIEEHSSFMTVNVPAAEQALLALPAVRSARVLKHFPGGIEIVLEPRRAAAMAFVEEGGRIFPALIGGDGMIFSVGRAGFRENEVLPVISGLTLGTVFPGMKLPRIYHALFAELEALSREAPELLAAISEIRINPKDYNGYDLTLYPAYRGVRVRVGHDITEETLRYMLLMLDVLSEKSHGIREIDFRTGTASYKEAYSG
ncbi:MAG: FtsQ-type POTRA domain-containing protein [Treponema sp.]|jgi:cell division protein FtsQ|nr:FtsQ-type POTRA domain-containing protein [Treponema sp.]